jgi:hypothetical protein
MNVKPYAFFKTLPFKGFYSFGFQILFLMLGVPLFLREMLDYSPRNKPIVSPIRFVVKRLCELLKLSFKMRCTKRGGSQ